MSVVASRLRARRRPSSAADFRGGAGLELDLLRTLVAIADTGSFNRAARAVFRTPVGRLHADEEAGGAGGAAALRQGRALGDPDAGRRGAGRLRPAHPEACRRGDAALPRAADRRARSGSARRTTIAGQFLPDILARFAASHPNVEVDVLRASSYELLELLDEGRARRRARAASGHKQPRPAWSCTASRSSGPGFATAARMSGDPCRWLFRMSAAAGGSRRSTRSTAPAFPTASPIRAGTISASSPPVMGGSRGRAAPALVGQRRSEGARRGIRAAAARPLRDRAAPHRRRAGGPLFDALDEHIVNNFRSYDARVRPEAQRSTASPRRPSLRASSNARL